MKLELQLAALLACATLFGAAVVLAQTQGQEFAGGWFLLSLLFSSFVWLQCWRRRELNRAAADSSLHPTLGWANRITLVRGVLIAACGGFLWPDTAALATGWICAPLYTVAAILDRVDGFVARRGRRITLLGTELDTVVDALGLLVAPLLAIGLGKIHWSYLLVSAAYYFFQFGLYWRRKHGRPVYPLLPSKLRRVLAGFQMGFIAAVLWPPILAPLTMITGMAFMVPVLIGFGVDWLVVSGRIQPRLPRTAELFSKVAAFIATFFQPALRLLLVVAVFMFTQNLDMQSMPQGNRFWSATVLTYALGLCAALIALGLAGRISALVLLCLLAWYFPATGLNSAMTAVVVTAVWILLLGCGRFSVWQGDDRWVARYDGL